MTDELETTEEVTEDACPLCECEDCPGTDPDSTERLAEHSKVCPEKHF